MNRGWVRIHRRIRDNRIWTEEKFTAGQAWVDLILLANHSDKTINVRGIEVVVKRGQVAWGKDKLAKRWGWSKAKLYRYIKRLETEQQIELQNSNVISLITVKNYNTYQTGDTPNDTTKAEKRDNKRYTMKEWQKNDINNNKQIKKNYKDFDKFQLNDGTIAVMRYGKWCDNNPPYPTIDRSYYKDCPPHNT